MIYAVSNSSIDSGLKYVPSQDPAFFYRKSLVTSSSSELARNLMKSGICDLGDIMLNMIVN
jgi:hypothetical protein